jgi:hypothetical protein
MRRDAISTHVPVLVSPHIHTSPSMIYRLYIYILYKLYINYIIYMHTYMIFIYIITDIYIYIYIYMYMYMYVCVYIYISLSFSFFEGAGGRTRHAAAVRKPNLLKKKVNLTN